MNIYEKCQAIRKLLINRAAEVMVYHNWSDKFAAEQIRKFPADVKKMKGGDELFDLQPSEMTDKQLESLGFQKWSLETPMRLIPLWILPFVADEIKIEDINGKKKIIKKEDIDTDNRFGCLAYGVIPVDA